MIALPELLIIDHHVHAHPPHADGDMDAFAQRAREQGIMGIVILAHSPLPEGHPLPFDDPGARLADDRAVAAYLKKIEALRKRYPDLIIMFGMEFDHGFEEETARLLEKFPIDLSIGAVHYPTPQKGVTRQNYDNWLVGEKPEKLLKIYFQDVANMAKHPELYDVIAHLNRFTSYYHKYYKEEIEWKNIKEIRGETLNQIVESDLILEFNTSRILSNGSAFDYDPQDLDMLKEASSLGIPIILSSDAHQPDLVAANFMGALEMMEKAGYECIHNIINGQRRPVKIVDAKDLMKENRRTFAEKNIIVPGSLDKGGRFL